MSKEIRLATGKDRPGLVSLWHQVFLDEPDYIEKCLDDFAGPKNVFVYAQDDTVGAMLLAVPCVAAGRKGVYHFALATKPELRGKGVMAGLMDYAENVEKDRGCAFAALIPASRSLFGYYANHGYATLSLRQIRLEKQDLLESLGEKAETGKVIVPDRNTLVSLRGQFSRLDCVHFYDSRAEMVLDAAVQGGGRFYTNEDGYCVYYVRNDVLAVAELFFTNEAAASAALFDLLIRTGTHRVSLTLALQNPLFAEKGVFIPSAMVKVLSDNFDADKLYLRFGIDEVFDKDYETV